MSDKELKYRISADGQQAISETERVSEAQRKMVGTTDQVGEAAEKAAPKQGRFAASIGGIVESWAAVALVAGAILKFLRDVADEATKSAAAVVEVGKSLRGLTVNVGGKRAAEIYQEATTASAEQRLDPQGRAQVLEAAARYTDIRDDATPQQLRDFINRSAQIQRLTGMGGKQQADAMIAFENAGMLPAEAEASAVRLFSSGFNAQAVTDVLNKTGPRGGREILGLMLGARGTGMDTERISRSLPSLMDILDRTDSSGRLDPQLARLGIQQGMSIPERINYLAEAQAAGQLKPRDVNAALGTSQNIATFEAFSKAITSGQVAKANADLRDWGNPIADAQLALEANPFVQAQERENVRRLYEQVRRERSSLGGFGERMRDAESNVSDLPLSAYWGPVVNLGTSLSPEYDVEAQTQTRQRLMGVNPPQNINITNIYHPIYNGDDPLTGGIERR